MKMRFYFLLPVVLFFVFIGCSNDGDGSGKDDNSNSTVPTAGKDLDKLLEDAAKSLEDDNWSDAVEYYNAAYEKDNSDTRAIIYSTLANLAKISVDPKVVDLIKNNFGFTEYPTKLNALFSDGWMKETPSVELDYYDSDSRRYAEWYYKGTKVQSYSGSFETVISTAGYYYYDWQNDSLVLVSSSPVLNYERLPSVNSPSWIKGSGSLYDSYLLNNAFSVENWALSIITNIIDRNSNGFNSTLDEVIDGVFGTYYNEAVKRLKNLENRKEERIKLDPYFIEKFELEEVFDEYDGIGWAEVNAVLSAMLAVKASLEWVQTYDLNTDLNWLKYAWEANPDEAEQSLLNHFKSLPDNQIPFNNNFLKARSDKSMATPKATYIAAVQGLQTSYASIQNSDLYPSEVKNAYPAINDGFNKLIAAINNGGKFYIPKDDPTKINAWPASSNGAQATVNLGKLFEPGYFAIDKIFETDADGKPVFYLRREIEECYDEEYWSWCDYSYVHDKLTKNNYAAEIADGGRLSLKLNANRIAAIADETADEEEYVSLGLSQEHAKAIVEKYYK